MKEVCQSKNCENYEMEIIGDIKDFLDNFQSVDEKNTKSNKPLRLSKNV